jgi:hypothetical protein
VEYRDDDAPNLPQYRAPNPNVGAPGYSNGPGESGLEDRSADAISPTGTGAPGDSGGPDISGLPPAGPIDAPKGDATSAADYHPERAYMGDTGGLGGASSVGTGTQAGKELGQTVNQRRNQPGTPDRSNNLGTADKDDAETATVTLAGAGNLDIDTDGLIHAPDSGVRDVGASSASTKNPRGIPGSPSDTDTGENLSMGGSTGDNIPTNG